MIAHVRSQKYFATGLKISHTALGLGSSVVMARMLGPDQFGIYSLTLSLITLCAFPLYNGLPLLMVREAARASSSDDVAKVVSLRRWAMSRTVYMSLAGIVVAVMIWLVYRLGNPEIGALTIAIGAMIIPVFGFSKAFGALLRGIGLPLLGLAGESLVQPLFVFTLAASAVFFSNQFHTAELMLSLYLVSACAALAFSLFCLREQLPRCAAQSPTVERRVWDSAILSLSLVSGIQYLNSQFGLLIVGYMGTSE
ncbi:MAG: oligosaccharide flippase family protein, partial [Pseudomonadota bacterium]